MKKLQTISESINEALSAGLELDEYIKQVCDQLLEMFDDKTKKYVDLTPESMEQMISGKDVDGEWILNYPESFEMSVEDAWEEEVSVEDAVAKFAPGVKGLVEGQAGAM